ncbi:MAG: aldo/keto reductase [Spirochaetota bacterium]|nr:aldo/keto reductase [Spirochaetota bacterium]
MTDNADTHPSRTSMSPARHQPAELGLGCWSFGDSYWLQARPEPGAGPLPSNKKYKKIIQAAIKTGIRHFDTAQGYGNGISEQITGQALHAVRPGVSIATKTYFRPPDTMRKGIERSLRRLNTDYIDIFYLHWPKPGRDLRPHMEALESARETGLIRHIGVSNFSPAQIRPLMEAGRVDYCQFGYSLIWRNAERELVPFCLSRGISMVSYSSLAQGILAHHPGWLDELPAADPRRSLGPASVAHRSRVRSLISEVYTLAHSLGTSPARLSLAWILGRGWFRYVLFGARSVEQLLDCAGAPQLSLPEEIRGRLDDLTAPLAELLGEEDNIFGHSP